MSPSPPPFGQFGAPEVSLLEPCLRLNGRGGSRIFFIRGTPKLRTNRTLAPVGWVQGVSEGDVPPQKWKEIDFLKQICDTWCILFA